MEENSIEEFPTSKNFRSENFEYNKQKYEINVSLYSNAILVFISFNGKIANLYELNIDIDEELAENNFGYAFGCDAEDNIKDIAIAKCILGKRGNDQMNFIANFIISYIKDIIIKINTKIDKICLSLSLDKDLMNNIEDNNKVKIFLEAVKDKFGKIFNSGQK